MSDLVPLVAAVLGEHSSVELAKENDELREEIKRRDEEMQRRDAGIVRITGPNGVYPTYAEGLLRDDNMQFTDFGPLRFIYIGMSNSTGENANPVLPTCPVKDMGKCVVYFGGIRIGRLEDCRIKPDYVGTKADSTTGDGYQIDIHYFLSKEKLSFVNDAFSFGNEDAKMNLYLYTEFGPKPLGAEKWAPEDCNNEDIQFVRFTKVEVTGRDLQQNVSLEDVNPSLSNEVHQLTWE